MADPEQLTILRQGVEAWNAWKMAHPLTRPDLSRADLSRADLSRADLSSAFLSFADLSSAYLGEANLSSADLIRANLSSAYLGRANLSSTHLGRANLNEANLSSANLTGAYLTATDMTDAIVGGTHFADLDLRTVRGLETLKHERQSHVSITTLYRSAGQIPESFLRKAGVPEDFLTYLPSNEERPFSKILGSGVPGEYAKSRRRLRADDGARTE